MERTGKIIFVKLGVGAMLLLQNALLLAQAPQDATVPVLFEPGLISTAQVETSSTFSRDGKELYFARRPGKWGQGKSSSFIYRSVKQNGSWSPPELASFSGTYNDGAPHLSQDGNQLYFISSRPSDTGETSADIWITQREADGNWGTPRRLPSPINSSFTEYSPRTDAQGNLYFASTRPGGYGQGDLYMAKRVTEGFGMPINLGPAINSQLGEWNLGINRSGDILVFEASQRAENLSSYGDLYISFKIEGQWTPALNLKELNTTGSNLYPYMTPDGGRLYFTSSATLESTDTNIFSVAFKPLVSQYRKRATSKGQ